MKFYCEVWFVMSAVAFIAERSLVSAQASVLASVDVQFQQILNSLIDRENRVKSLNSIIQAKVNASILGLKSNTAFAPTVTALQNVNMYLGKIITVNSYGGLNITLACDSIALKIASIPFDIQRYSKIDYDAKVNNSLLYVQYATLYGAYWSNNIEMSNAQKLAIESILTSMFVLVDEYNQYSLTIAMAVYNNVRLYVDLLNSKQTSCSCPSLLSSAAIASFSTIDKTIGTIQSSTIGIEASIRNYSAIIISQIAGINPVLKKNSSYLSLTTTLDSISTLLNGYLLLTTKDIINSTSTCDDAASKLAYIEFKMNFYFQAHIEAAVNTTLVIVQLNNLNVYYYASVSVLSGSQVQSLKEIIAAVTSLADTYRQYILSLYMSFVNYIQPSIDAKQARLESCNCSQISSPTTLGTSNTDKQNGVSTSEYKLSLTFLKSIFWLHLQHQLYKVNHTF